MPAYTDIQTLPDEQLLKNYFAEADNVYLEELFGRYIRFVYLVSMKYLKADELAKDMSMQVFEKVTADITRFEIVHFKSWLYKVTCNSCLMQLRSNKHFQTLSIDDENVLKKNVEISIDEHHFKENNHEMKIEQLQMAIETLNYEQKQCVTLFYLQEKSYKDVAELTGFSENSVKSYIQNGKRNLKNILLKSFESGVWLLLILNMK